MVEDLAREEGMYYEKMFSPVSIKLVKVKRDPEQKRSWDEARKGEISLILEDQNGEKLKVEGNRLVGRVLGYLKSYTGLGISDMKEMPAEELQQLLDKTCVKVRNEKKQFKALFDENGKLSGIVSTIHKQISWKKVREIVEKAVQEVCGQVVQPEGTDHPFRWSYHVPVEAENQSVSAWVGVHAGNNIINGRSGVHIWSRWRTERAESEGGIQRPACLNWCGMWMAPLQFFGIDTRRMDNIYKVLGAENVENLKLAQFHISPDMEEFAKEVKGQLKGMVKSMKKMKVVIDESIHSPLSRKEMEAILEAYRRKLNLPKYVIEQILDQVRAETVWGFSQAVSWVRTHGEFKEFKICKPVEDRDLTRKLENMAGEVLSLTPTINDLHRKVGEITLEKLLPGESVEVLVRR